SSYTIEYKNSQFVVHCSIQPLPRRRGYFRTLLLSTLVCVVIYLCITSAAKAQTFDDHDFELRNDNTFVIPLLSSTSGSKKKDRLNLLIGQTNRIGCDGFYLNDERIGAGFDVILNKYLSFSPTYLYRASRSNRFRWDYEHRIRFDATVGKSWNRFGIKNRNRIERRIRNSRSDSTRYRNRTTVNFPISSHDKKVFDIYSSIEPFYDFNADQWTVYEFAAGLSRKFDSHISGEFFYFHRGNLQANQTRIDAVGVNLKIRIGK
ncbi:MAG: DUF2490 domain-containing protein, partial [Pyrinomonadaceae bacterium]